MGFRQLILWQEYLQRSRRPFSAPDRTSLGTIRITAFDPKVGLDIERGGLEGVVVVYLHLWHRYSER